jgi:hypothetical protein
MSLEVSIKAMRDDAKLWQDTANILGTAADSAAGLDLGEQDLSFASVGTNVLGEYARVQYKAEQLLREGNQVLGALSKRLTEVADAYEASDAKASKQFAGVWEPKR